MISDITKRMGAGMAEFVSKDLGQGTTSTVDYDKYCHYVAGLVGDGLTRLFVATGIEGQELLLAPELANRCGFSRSPQRGARTLCRNDTFQILADSRLYTL